MPRQPPQKERDAMRVVIQEDYRKMCKWAADYIAAKIKAHREDRPFVLGLPTGSSPIGVYQELIRQTDDSVLQEAKQRAIAYNLAITPGTANAYSEDALLSAAENYNSQLDIAGNGIIGYRD